MKQIITSSSPLSVEPFEPVVSKISGVPATEIIQKDLQDIGTPIYRGLIIQLYPFVMSPA